MKHRVLIFLLGILVGSLSGAMTATLFSRHNGVPVTTNQITITDKSGHARATMGVDALGQVSLEMFGPDQTRQLSLGVKRNIHMSPNTPPPTGEDLQLWVPMVELDDVSGRKSAVFTTSGHGNSVLSFYGQKDLFRLGVGYVGAGNDDGPPLGMWGLRARRGFDGTAIGLYDFTTSNGDKYLLPNVNQPHPLGKNGAGHKR